LSESLQNRQLVRNAVYILYNIPQEAPYDMLQQPHSLLIHQLRHHIRQHRTNGIEAFVSLANILQTHIVEQNLLHNKDGDCLAELRTRLHDTEAEGYYLSREEEVNYFGAVVLDEGANDSEGRQAQVLEGPAL
jgi:hypothetical protein